MDKFCIMVILNMHCSIARFYHHCWDSYADSWYLCWS